MEFATVVVVLAVVVVAIARAWERVRVHQSNLIYWMQSVPKDDDPEIEVELEETDDGMPLIKVRADRFQALLQVAYEVNGDWVVQWLRENGFGPVDEGDAGDADKN